MRSTYPACHSALSLNDRLHDVNISLNSYTGLPHCMDISGRPGDRLWVLDSRVEEIGDRILAGHLQDQIISRKRKEPK